MLGGAYAISDCAVVIHLQLSETADLPDRDMAPQSR